MIIRKHWRILTLIVLSVSAIGLAVYRNQCTHDDLKVDTATGQYFFRLEGAEDYIPITVKQANRIQKWGC